MPSFSHNHGGAQDGFDAAYRRRGHRADVNSLFVLVEGFDVVAGHPASHDLAGPAPGEEAVRAWLTPLCEVAQAVERG